MEDLIVNGILLLIFVAIAGVSVLVAAPNTVVLILQCFWAEVPATLTGESKRTVTQGKHLSYERDHDTGEYEWETRKGTSVSWEPRLRVHYTWQEKTYTKDNQDSWNHRLHYTENSSKRAMKRFFAQRPYPLRVNPRRPFQFFLGFHQFPWLAVLVATLSSLLFLSVSLSTLFDMLPSAISEWGNNRLYWTLGGAVYGITCLGFVIFYCWPTPSSSSAQGRQKP